AAVAHEGSVRCPRGAVPPAPTAGRPRAPPPAAPAAPETRLFGRANRRRLDAECIRDTMLAVSGQLAPDRGGPTFPTNLPADYGYKSADTRRSVYLPVFRNAISESLEAFDFADPSVVTGRRNVSTVASQALYLPNHPFPAGP